MTEDGDGKTAAQLRRDLLLLVALTPLLCLALLAAVMLLGVPLPAQGATRAAAAARTAAPTATRTPMATATPAPTQTARVIVVTATPAPTSTPSPSPTPSTAGSPPGEGDKFCLPILTMVCLPGHAGLDWGVGSLVTWLTGGLHAVTDGIGGLLVGVVRVDKWTLLAGLLTWMGVIGGGVAGALFAIGLLLYVRASLPGASNAAITAGLAGAAMVQRAMETGVLIAGMTWIGGQVLDIAQAAADSITNNTGTLGPAQLGALLADLALALSNPIMMLVAVIGAIVFLLLLLVKLESVGALAWMLLVGPLALATWPLGARLAGNWFWNFLAVALWGAGWAVWLKIVEAALADFTINPGLRPVLVLALLLLGYGVPRLVDRLLGTSMHGGGGLAGFVVGLGTGMATRGMGHIAAQAYTRFIK